MKIGKSTANRLSHLTLGMAITTLLSISPSSFAANPDWARDYVGTVNFRLSDDPGMRDREYNINRATQNHRSVLRNLDRANNEAKTLISKKRKLDSKITEQSKKLTTLVNKKETNKKQLQALKVKLPQIESDINVAKAAVSGATNAVETTKAEVTNVSTKLTEVKTQCDANPTDKCKKKVARISQKLQNLKQKLTNQTKTLNQSKTNLAAKQKVKTNHLAAIKNKTAEIAKNEKDSATLASKINENNIKANKLKEALKRKHREIAPLKEEERIARVRVENHRRDIDGYRSSLIMAILDSNRTGSAKGGNDGHIDGSDLARDLGNYHGAEDGSDDGLEDGEYEGRSRDKKQGYASGLIAGNQRANSEGEANGRRNGTRQGNIDAATRAGNAAGTLRANNSDASDVGAKQGTTAGYDRAVNTGKRNGGATGANQAISESESGTLNVLDVQGAFSGAFDRYVPNYPRDRRGSRYYNRPNYRRNIVNIAYKTGYDSRYRGRHQSAYMYIIDDIYNTQYDNSYNNAYDESYRRDYPNSRKEGFNSGESFAYKRDYPGIYNTNFSQYRRDFSSNPNVNSQEYKTTYSQTEGNTYTRRYEEIRHAQYVKVEGSTFKANIAEQTEKYRIARFNTVKAIYKNNPVLKYVSSEMKDGGINNVGKLDGVYQPGESTLHNVTLINYGSTAAKNTKLVLNSGETVNLPAIPAKSQVTIVGAAKSAVLGNIGETNKKSITLFSSLNAEKIIQGRHFANKTNGQINFAHEKKTSINYPISLSSLSTKTTPLFGQETPLSIAVKNNSNRAYSGDLEIVLDVDSNSNIIKKGFNNITSLSGSTVLNDARVLVNNEDDVYQRINFNAKIMKNGVMLGRLNKSFSTMAKSAYKKKSSRVVVLANSDQNRNDLLQIIDDLGGIKKVAILDTSLKSQNAGTVNKGLIGKTIITTIPGRSSEIDKLTKSSIDIAFLFVSNGAIDDARSLPSFKEAQSFDLDLVGIDDDVRFMFSNTLEVKGMKTSTTAMQSTMRGYKKLMVLANNFTLNNKQIMSKLKSNLTRSNFFENSYDKRHLMHAAFIRSLDEVSRISKHYENSGDWSSRNTNIADLVYNNNYLHKMIANAVTSDPNSSTVGLYMFASDFYVSLNNALKHYRPIQKKMMSKVHTRLFDGKLFSKSAALKPIRQSQSKLRKKYRNEYNAITSKRGYIAPFKLAVEND